MLPNFIHAGVPKAASGTFEMIFRIHPEIFTTRAKELDFFNHEKNFAKGVNWYEENFFQNASGLPVICDRSIGYSTGLALDVSRRVFEALGPNVKFLFILRHPVDRAYSQYCMARYKGQIDRLPFSESVERAMSIGNEITDDDIRRLQSGSHYSNKRDLDIFRYCLYLETGLYSNTLAKFSRFFSSENILVLFVDDIVKDLQTEANKVFDFLAVARIDVGHIKKRNESQTLMRPAIKRFANAFYGIRLVRYLLNSVISAQLRRGIKRLVLSNNYKKNTRVPRADLGTQIRLQKFYYSDIERTQLATGRDLSAWLNKYPTS